LRILLACPYAWDAPGGVQVHVRQLASHLRGRGHEVLVLAPGRTLAVEPWVRVVGRPVPVRYNGSVAPICPSPASARAVKRAMDRFRPDVVHVHEPFTPSTSMFAALRSNAPVVATFHAYADRSALRSLASPVLRLVWRKLDVRIAVSKAAASFAAGRFGGDVRIVPNGVDVELFREAEPAALPPGRSILFVNRLDRRKGFSIAVAAFGILAERHDDLHLVVAGDGEERNAVFDLDPYARARVVMLGNVPHEKLPPYHAAADVFVAPARGRESFGIVLVEAMAAGLSVVASAIPGYDEVVRDGVDGLLVRPSDPAALAGGVNRVLGDPELAGRLGEAGRARAGEFAWDRVAGELESIYSEAVSG
jgi:phosphatidylinositol alpha-mannosyltransferase